MDNIKQKIKGAKEYPFTIFSSIIAVIISIIIFFSWDELSFLGSILMMGVTGCGLLYNIEHRSNESKKEKMNTRKFLSIEIGSTTSNLERFLNDGVMYEELQTGDNIKLWYKFSNQIIEAFEMIELELLYDFFRGLKEIDDLSKIKTKVDFDIKLYIEVLIENNVLLGEHLLKKVFNEENRLKLNKNEISLREFYKIIYLEEEFENLEQCLLELDKQEKVVNLFKKIMHRRFRIPEDRLQIFTEFLFKNGGNLQISIRQSSYFLRELILTLEYQQQLNIIKKCASKDESLIMLVILLWGNSTHSDKFFVHILGEIISIILIHGKQKRNIKRCAEKIQLWAKNGKLISCNQLKDILYYWSLIESKQVVEEFIKNSLKDENKTIKLIKGFKKGNDPLSFEIDIMNKLISLEYVKEQLNKKKYSNEHKNLIEEFKRQMEEYNS